MFDRDKPYATVIEPGRRAFLQDGVLYAPDGRRLMIGMYLMDEICSPV